MLSGVRTETERSTRTASAREKEALGRRPADREKRGMEAHVQLRPVIESDLDALDAFGRSQDDAGAFQWYGFAPSYVRRKFAEGTLLGPAGGTLTVVAEGDPAGTVDWFKASWGREESACWRIGVAILPGMRGRGIGTQAQRLLVDYLFAHTRAERIEAFTDKANRAERRALEKIGFCEEGVLRSAQWRNGAWCDQVLYSILRSSWSAP